MFNQIPRFTKIIYKVIDFQFLSRNTAFTSIGGSGCCSINPVLFFDLVLKRLHVFFIALIRNNGNFNR